MNYKEIFNNINTRVSDAILSLWSEGDKNLQDYLRYILNEEEKLQAEPVFQSTFPWKSDSKSMKETNLFEYDFIKAIDDVKGQYRFPLDRLPFEHQINSWKLLNDSTKRNSVVITSGTGSGKTECFLAPIMQDLHIQNKEGKSRGVQALFLYPLNALMGSQKKRVKAWSKSLPNPIRFAVYNGKTQHLESKSSKATKEFPELIDRPTIRNNPPQMLFTNPTMLEYMLVRKEDQNILSESKGTLRWIVLDEAHTYTGSAAAELALLIRRVLIAFDVKASDIRFAVTSATIGDGSEETSNLKKFLKDITGQDENQIHIISGAREVPKLIAPTKSLRTFSEVMNASFEDLRQCYEVHDLRKELNEKPALSLSEIGKKFSTTKKEQIFELIQKLTEDPEILSVRAHFHLRTLPGIYACVNPACTRHQNLACKNSIESLSTRLSKSCSECGFPMLEFISCGSCGTHILKGEEHRNLKVRIRGQEIEESNSIEDEGEEKENEYKKHDKEWKPLYLAHLKDCTSKKAQNLYIYGIDQNGELNQNQNQNYARLTDSCPTCDARISKFRYYQVGTIFYSKILAPILLEQAPPVNDKLTDLVWDGKKYLTFTDSRQGTAKISASLNNDVERTWVRTRLYHSLCSKRESGKELSPDELQKYKALKTYKETNNSPLFDNEIKDFEIRLNALQNKDLIPSPKMSWKDFLSELQRYGELKTLKNHVSNSNPSDEDYAHALLLDQFARRPKREVSLETMGLVKITYPDLMKCNYPEKAKDNGITKEEWQDFLKICVDYFLRNNIHISIPENIKPLIVQPYYSKKIYPSDFSDTKDKLYYKWPVLKEKQVPQRLITLLCAGLGYCTELDDAQTDVINTLMSEAWKGIKQHLLTGSDNEGYVLELREKASFELILSADLCPNTRKPLDTSFKGYSPWIKGKISQENFNKFLIKHKDLKTSYFPYANRLDSFGNTVSNNTILEWLNGAFLSFKEHGLWSDIYEKIIFETRIYLSAEHSAQQKSDRLEWLEEQFDKGKLNILNCSTTMEMGVDIGGISIVLMNNVPPYPANYLQRAGRAGRRQESRSLALTLCSSNPVGEKAFKNPKWAMTEKIYMPDVDLKSNTIVYRHINSFLFGFYIRNILDEGGIQITKKVDSFFETNSNGGIQGFLNWLRECEKEPSVEEGLKKITNDTNLFNQPLNNLIYSCVNSAEKIKQFVDSKKEFTENQINLLKNEGKFNDESLGIKALRHSLNNILQENLLTFLVSKGFLPSSGIPIGIIEFDTTMFDTLNQKNTRTREDNLFQNKGGPTREIKKAIYEFQPGEHVIIDGWSYQSSGIILDTEYNKGNLQKIRNCNSCGYQFLITDDYEKPCQMCGKDSFSGLIKKDEIKENFSEIIEPAGFSVDLYDKPTRKINFNSYTKYTQPILLGMTPWIENESRVTSYRDSSKNIHAEILYYNIGQGLGFKVCTKCGRTAVETGLKSEDTKDTFKDHYRLRGGRERRGLNRSKCLPQDFNIRENVIIAGRFKTDVFEFRVKDNPKSFSDNKILLTTLAVAFKYEFVKELGIDDDEIGYGIRQNSTTQGDFLSVFFYDTAKGGAGYSTRLETSYLNLFKRVYERLKACDCKASCTRCLIDRNSQWFLDALDRKVFIKWYEDNENYFTTPEEIKQLKLNLEIELLPLFRSFIENANKKDVSKIRIFIDGDISKWSIENFKLYNELRNLSMLKKEIEFIVSNYKATGEIDFDLFIHAQFKSWAKLYVLDSTPQKFSSVTPLYQCINEDNTMISCFKHPDKNFLELSENESFESIDPIYITEKSFNPLISELKPPKLPSSLNSFYTTDSFIKVQEIGLSSFGKFIFEDANQALDKEFPGGLLKYLENQSVEVIYSDRYLKSPFGAFLLYEMLFYLKKAVNVKYNRMTFLTESVSSDFRNPTSTIMNSASNWQSDEARTNFLTKIIPSLEVKLLEKKEIAHYRYMKLLTKDLIITIRPEGGFEHGWQLKTFHNTAFPFNGDLNAMWNSFDEHHKHCLISAKYNYPILYSVSKENRIT